MAAGQDGNMWFTDEGATSAIGRVTRECASGSSRPGLGVGAKPAVLTAAADGALWFSDEGTDDALGSALSGRRRRSGRALRERPRSGRRRPAVHAGPLGTLGTPSPSTSLFGFDGYRWFRDGVRSPIRLGHYTPTAADRGRRLSCRSHRHVPGTVHYVLRPASHEGVKVDKRG